MTIAAEKIPMKSRHLDLNTRLSQGWARAQICPKSMNNLEMLRNVNVMGRCFV
jgi:hypothetical protein